MKQLHINNHSPEKICSLLKKQSDCNQILDSDAAKILGYSWSEIGFGYFVSNILVIVFLPSLFSYFAFINACSLPYTLWSVWYQKYKAKQWCVLCIITQSLLWLLFFNNLLFGNIILPDFSIQNLILIGCIYLIPLLCLNNLVEFFSQVNEKYKNKADDILDQVCQIVATKIIPMSLYGGLCGLGCGLAYLIRNGFIDANEDDFLLDIDDLIIKYIQKNEAYKYKDDILKYIQYRMLNCNKKLIKSEFEEFSENNKKSNTKY